MNPVLQPDLCILGGGAGGISLAVAAASQGLSVVLVEKAQLGGSHLTRTLPLQALIAASRVAPLATVDTSAGTPTRLDFHATREKMAATLARSAAEYSQKRLEALNVSVIREAGRFTGKDRLTAGHSTIAAHRFVIATGAVEKSLAIPGLELVRPLDCAALCTLSAPPRHLILLGSDPTGLALAQALRAFGSEVTVLAESQILPQEDEELCTPVRLHLLRTGVNLHENVRVTRIEPRKSSVRLFLAWSGSEKLITGSDLLIAAGRMPLVEGLGLKDAGVRYTRQGIETRADFLTSNRRVHAIGACVRECPQDGAAEQQSWLVLRSILGLPQPLGLGQAVAKVIPTDPPIAIAGLSEEHARLTERRLHVMRWPLPETDKGRLEPEIHGHVKLLANSRGRLVGAGIVGRGAEELIHLCSLALWKGMTASDIASIMIAYPSLADAVRRACWAMPAQKQEWVFKRNMLLFGHWVAERLKGERNRREGLS
ncbi:MAG TPA: FAD-dependent oxidoreductase [Methylocella sp.]|nr:FAD-dependent oxidoreductase [Methylocella sp.]